MILAMNTTQKGFELPVEKAVTRPKICLLALRFVEVCESQMMKNVSRLL